MIIMLMTRLIMGATGVLILATLGSPAVLGRDDKPAKAEEVKGRDDKAKEDKVRDDKPAKAEEVKGRDEKAKEDKVRDDKPAKAKEDKVRGDKPAKAEEGKVRNDKAAMAKEAEDNNAIQFGAQLAPYFRQIYKNELRYMRLVTEPTKQQYEKIAAEADPSVKVALKEYANRFNGLNGGGRKNSTSNPILHITDAITKAVKTHLSPEQATRYQKELGAQLTACKRMAVDNLVVMVDKALNLSTDQRSKLVDIFLDNWDDSWSQTQYYFNSGRWFPAMPDGKISPILTESQRAVWNGTNKTIVNFGIFNGVALEGDGLDEEIWPEDGPKKSEVLPSPREKAPNGGGKK